jgi:hypothetical protein
MEEWRRSLHRSRAASSRDTDAYNATISFAYHDGVLFFSPGT